MDVQTAAATGPGQSAVSQPQEATASQAPQAVSSNAPSSNTTQQHTPYESTIAAAVAKIYNVSQGSSGEPAQLSVSYKYVSQLQLVVTVFTNASTGEEVAQFPPQELIGLAEMFDQIDGVTLDRKV